MAINRVVLVGRLTRDVELRAMSNGESMGRFTIAVERNFTNSQGEREADFISATIWRKAAENFANFTGKGALVAIEGSLRTGSYTNQQGQVVYTTDVNVDNFTLLETRSQSEARRNGNGVSNNSSFNQAQQTTNSPNFEQQSTPVSQNSTPETDINPWNRPNNNDSFDISENDLPFD
ncbi:MAG: single-stranded DNA-binding protein [Lactobacillaceae bacterium]|jgi:single-strand DNA-binding protein|nr:single-stranded DNA-binding protein [Lactobacillaceae bacterium]